MRNFWLDQLKHSSSLIRAFAALSAWRSYPLSASSKAPDQTGWMPRLIWQRSPSLFCQAPNWLLINEVNFPECRHMIQCGFMVCRNVSDEYCVLTLVFQHTYLRGNYCAETNNRISVKIHMSVCWLNQQKKKTKKKQQQQKENGLFLFAGSNGKRRMAPKNAEALVGLSQLSSLMHDITVTI